MTTIVAVETTEGVTFASDSRITGTRINDGWVPKVFKNNGIVFGVAGYLRVSQILQHADLPKPPKNVSTKKLDKWVTGVLAPAFVAVLRDYADGDDKKKSGSDAIVCINGRVYDLGFDGSWTRSNDGYYATGSGYRYALGALAAGAAPKEAVAIASKFDYGTNDDVRVTRIKN